MIQPAKPASSSRPPSDEEGRAAGSSLADAIASVAVTKMKKPAEDPDKKWEEMGGELFDVLEKKDKANFGRLFAKQVRLAVKEALRGDK